MKIKVAVARYRIGEPSTFADFAHCVGVRVAAAAAGGAGVVVLPEYLALEAAAILPADARGDLHRSLAGLQRWHEAYLALAGELARRHSIHLVAGTFLLDIGGGRYRNRACLVAPDGRRGWQDKLTLTGYEREAGVIEVGDELKVFDTELGRIGIDICYDIEFPLYARAQAEAGANLLLVPSCTDTQAGATRVRVGCQARALENQVFVACAVTAGEAPWSPVLDVNRGAAAICTPIDRGFPPDGIAAQASSDADWALAELDLDALDELRREGQVANAQDWMTQLRPAVARARLARLG